MLNTLNDAELLILALFLCAWVIGSANLIWARFVKGRVISRTAIGYWLGLSIVLISGKLVLTEYLLHLSLMHEQTEFWTRMGHLMFFEAQLAVFTGAVYAESEQVWRLLFYPTVGVVSVVSLVPLLAFGMKPRHT